MPLHNPQFRFNFQRMKDVTAIRELLFNAAYHMLGEVQDSGDVVQEVLLDLSEKIESGRIESINNPTGYYLRATINKCINLLKNKNKLEYPGVWLPEPLLHPQNAQDSRIDIHYGFVHLLGKLNPKERAVFILRESFEISFGEIAEDLELNESHCRKLYQRSQEKLKRRLPAEPYLQKKEQLTQEFIDAVTSGDLEPLVHMLVKDIKIYSDGGGKVSAAMHPIEGSEACSRFLLNIWKNTRENLVPKLSLTPHGPVILFYDQREMKLATALVPEFTDAKLQTIYIQRNPDKLRSGNFSTLQGRV